jgi:peptide chain release factor subunit 3
MFLNDVFFVDIRMKVKIDAIWRDEKEVLATQSGENLRLRVTGVEDTDVSAGFVLSSIKSPVPCVTQFEAQLMIVELLEHNPVFTVRAIAYTVQKSF